MKVLSINVSQPREIDWQGRKVRTSIFKMPVGNRRHVSKLNIEGDAQSDLLAHGGEHRAIFVYQKESYDYWRTLFGRDDLSFGQFGENLTVEGLPDSEVCIGDRYRIGTIILEVTQPRVTCYKVAISTGIREMPALLVSHKRPGFYCRVICEGEVEAGDEITRLSTGPGAMTIVEVDGLLYSNAHPADRLRNALGIKALSAGWRFSLQALYDAAIGGTSSGNAGLAPPAMIAAWQGFIPFIVEAIAIESEGVRSIRLRPADGRSLPKFAAGQHIVLRLPGATPEGSPLIRMYSLCGPGNTTFYRIAVKEEPGGLASGYLHHRLTVGDTVDISAPRGTFLLKSDNRPIILIGAGIGITPLLAMLYAVAAEANGRTVWWLYTTRDSRQYPFRIEVRQILQQLPGSHRHTAFTRPQTNDIPGTDYDTVGRLTQDELRSLHLPSDGTYYLCGPPGFMTDMTRRLTTLGIPDSAIGQETFGIGAISAGTAAAGGKPGPHLPPEDPGSQPQDTPLISFAKSGLTLRWHPRWASLLEAAEDCDIPVNWSCRVGVCHRCETTLFTGDVDYSPSPLDNPTAGNILLCCSTPRTDVQLDL